MARWQPDRAGPKNLRSLYHWVWLQLDRVGALLGDEGGGGPPGHVHDHANLLNVTPDQHHPQLHDVVSHSDVMGVASQNEILRRDGANYVPDRRTKAHIQLTQPLDGDSLIGDLWVLR